MANKFYNTFRFTGEVAVPKEESKLTSMTKFDSGWSKLSMKLGVKESQTNSQFVTLDAMIPPTETYEMAKPHKDGSGKKVKYQYKDRQSGVVIDNVSDFAKLTVDFETDFDKKSERIQLQMKIRNLLQRDTLTDDDKEKLNTYKQQVVELSDNVHTFVNEIDVINFLQDNMEIVKAHKIRITGNVDKSTSKGKYYTNYKFDKFEFVDAETKNELKVSCDMYFDKDAVDESDFKDTKKVMVNTFIKSYDGITKEDRYYPQQFVIDAAKLDMENEKHVARLNFIKDTFKVKGKNVYHIPVELNLYNGSARVEFTIDMLEPRHRQQIELELKTLDDYKPKGGFVLGDRLTELKFSKLLDGNFEDGAEDTEISISEFEELVATSSADVNIRDVKKKEVEKIEDSTQDAEEDDDLDDLFN